MGGAGLGRASGKGAAPTAASLAATAAIIQNAAPFIGRSKNNTNDPNTAMPTSILASAKSSALDPSRAPAAAPYHAYPQQNQTSARPITPIRQSRNRNVLCGIPTL